MKRAQIHDIEFTPASGRDRRSGIIGWFSLTDDRKWRINGVCLRRTGGGNLVITFPSRRSSTGTEYHHVAPVDAELHTEVEDAIRAYIAKNGLRP